jgi:NAD(P)-dependent dehydrogenase (short-subunit alcohol dehydrogenase family)
MRLANKTLFIAGASGMAAATARLALEEGARVFVVDRSQVALSCLQESMLGGIETFCADMEDERAVDEAFRRCCGVYGGFDTVFHAIGLSGRRYGDGKLHECTMAGWRVTIASNATTAFLVSRGAIRHFLERQPLLPSGLRGTILNMASVLAASPEREFFATHAYAASKGAVIAMTKAAAAYYAPLKININAIAPGLVTTPMSERAQRDPAIMAFIQHKQPLPENLLASDDVARVAVFYLSDEARYITGQVAVIDGGWTVSN